jgi:DNA-binding response OmpR family regulator
LVDDDPSVREVMRRGLVRAGMNVLEAPDVLCTDCMMLGLPVPQLIDQFRKLHNGRVLVCSGYAPAETGLSSEMYDDFLVKPFASDDLVRRIHALMA